MLDPILSVDRYSYSGSTNTTIDMSLLDKYISDIENSLIDDTWLTKSFSLIDKSLLPNLVEMANLKKNGLNLTYLDSPFELAGNINKLTIDEDESYKFIINKGEDTTHYGLLDVRKIDGKLSILLFETTTMNDSSAALLTIRIAGVLDRDTDITVKPTTIEMDIQRSNSGCGIFCLALAKKFHSIDESISALHKFIQNQPYEKVKNSEIADQYLPISLYKHAQGMTRIKQYLKVNSSAIEQVVNKKGQTILERFEEKSDYINGKPVSNSIQHKRYLEYKALRDEHSKTSAEHQIMTPEGAQKSSQALCKVDPASEIIFFSKSRST